MTSFQNFLRVFVSFILWSCFAAAAQAQNPVGTWDLLETKDGAAVDKIVVSRDGTISYSEFPGSWSQSGSSMTATLYGNQSLRNAGKALGDMKLEVNGDLISGTLYVIPQRQTFNVFARRHGVSAAQAERPATAERENRDAERRREAEHERAARASAERVALAKATESRQALPVYQSPVVIIPAVSQTCSPGSSPARQANGQYVTVPPTAFCVKDSQTTSGQSNAPGSGAKDGGGTKNEAGSRQSNDRNSADDDRLVSNTAKGEMADSKKKKIDWGPIQLEALAICRQSKKSKKWWCDGPIQDLILVDSPTLEDALGGVGCEGATPAGGGTIKNGLEGDVYRCNYGLRSYDRNIGKIHGLITAQRSYMCPKFQGAKCKDFYDGQDKPSRQR